MQNIKLHLINIASTLLFSYVLAITINQFIKSSITPDYTVSSNNNRYSAPAAKKKNFEDYKSILESSFFKIALEDINSDNPDEMFGTYSGNLDDIYLLGTISGPASIARALIKKKGEKYPEKFKLWQDVYGYKLVRIDGSKIYLKSGDQVEVIDMNAQKQDTGRSRSSVPAQASRNNLKKKQTISRSEIQQKVLNNIDNALKGVRAGPHRVNGVIEGYKLFRVSPSNILYKLGARSGDIAKRINGHPINSTEKLLSLWQSIQDESAITVDLERRGKVETFEFSVTD